MYRLANVTTGVLADGTRMRVRRAACGRVGSGPARVNRLVIVAGLGLLVLGLPGFSAAQTGTLPLDAFLHGSGGTTNPPTLTLDLLPSISLTAKTTDSPSLAFSGGNPWKVPGSWTPSSLCQQRYWEHWMEIRLRPDGCAA